MKMLTLALASALSVAAPLAGAQWNHPGDTDHPYVAPDRNDRTYDRQDSDRHEDRARVVDSHPVYGNAGEHQECWNDQTNSYERHHIGAGTVIGAIAGGVLGHQVGSGHGNTAATAAGAIGGGVIGNRIDRNRADNDNADNNQRCRTVRDNSDNSRDIVAYDVRYEYRGQTYQTQLDHDPGQWLDVGRDIREDGTPYSAANPYPERPSYDPDRR